MEHVTPTSPKSRMMVSGTNNFLRMWKIHDPLLPTVPFQVSKGALAEARKSKETSD